MQQCRQEASIQPSWAAGRALIPFGTGSEPQIHDFRVRDSAMNLIYTLHSPFRIK
jgi:hypothetical protein